VGYRCVIPRDKTSDWEFRLVEVIMAKKAADAERVSMQVVIVDNHQDTLRHVRGNWSDFIDNVMKVKKMEEHDRKKAAESAEIFENRLRPLFTRISESASRNLLANLSRSLKKALILMAMERYAGDKDTICTVLGINRAKLDKEMNLCGVELGRKAA
jgi:DNA-binding NtrC family response regulator